MSMVRSTNQYTIDFLTTVVQHLTEVLILLSLWIASHDVACIVKIDIAKSIHVSMVDRLLTSITHLHTLVNHSSLRAQTCKVRRYPTTILTVWIRSSTNLLVWVSDVLDIATTLATYTDCCDVRGVTWSHVTMGLTQDNVRSNSKTCNSSCSCLQKVSTSNVHNKLFILNETLFTISQIWCKYNKYFNTQYSFSPF